MARPGGAVAERRLLAACLQVGRLDRGLARLAAGELDWTTFLSMAEAQAVAQTAWQALMEEDAAGPVPRAVLEALREAHQGSSAGNALLLHDLARVQGTLEKAGVASVALKGTALVAAYYPSVGARYVGDIDLLVGPRDLEAASRALAAAGLRPPEGQLPSWLGAEDPAMARNPGADHLLPLATWGGAILELHDRAPGGGPAAEEVLGRSRRIDWQGRSLTIPAPLDLAGIACVHALVKHRTEWHLRARHVADLHALMAAGPIPWDEVRARYGAGAGAAAIDDSLALLEAARREAAGEGRAPRHLGFLEAPPAGQAGADRLREQRDGLSRAWGEGGLASVALLLFPSRRYMEARHGLRPGSPAVWLLYPWRLVRGVLGLLRRGG
jgi:hypothetical protein